MAKTKEELDVLKAKIIAVKNELKSLSEDELKQIAGGDNETDCKKVSCPKCGSTNVSVDYTLWVYHCNKCGCTFY